MTTKNSKDCTSVAETEDKIDEMIASAKEKAEKATAKEEETKMQKIVEKELPQQLALHAEESEPEGNHMCID